MELSIHKKSLLKYWRGKGYASLRKLETFSSKCHKIIFYLIISHETKNLWNMTMEMFEITQREVAKNVNHSRWLFSNMFAWYSVTW